MDGCENSIISYPEIYTGEKPFSTFSLYQNPFLGKPVNKYETLSIYLDMNIIDFKGKFNVASETWLID